MNDITEEELHALNGGVLPWFITVIGGAIVGAAASNWPDFKQGFSDAFWHQQRIAEK